MMKKYFIQCVVSACVMLVLVAITNWLVDPYSIYQSPIIERFNSQKSITNNERIFEITDLLRVQPQALIIGTSREDQGIDPKSHVFKQYIAFNAAISGQPFVESKEILSELSKKHFPELIVFGLLFEAANVYAPVPSNYTKDNFNQLYKYKLLISSSTLDESTKTIKRSLKGGCKMTYPTSGFLVPDNCVDKLSMDQHQSFRASEKNYLFTNHFPLPTCKNTLVSDIANQTAPTPMNELRAAIAIAYRQKSDMRLFVGPSHARQWETIYASHLWSQFEEWKRMLVEITESEAVKAHATPFQVWDFSGYNSITEEDVPALGDMKKRMHYYYESSHYTPAAGDLVLDRIFNVRSLTRIVPKDFGVLLTSHNIDAHLASIRLARERYRQTHPKDVAEIEVIARDAAKNKHCPLTK